MICLDRRLTDWTSHHSETLGNNEEADQPKRRINAATPPTKFTATKQRHFDP
jgi:hypothetical protein